MLRKIAGSKLLVSLVSIALVVGIGATALAVERSEGDTVSYCAQLRDGVGVFEGNPVTRRGVTVGSISKVDTAMDGTARVTFTVDSDQKLPADVKASTISQSVLAVRQLALIGDPKDGPTLGEGQCIGLANTNTPLSVSKSLDSVSNIAKQLTVDGGPEQTAVVLRSVTVANKELAGVGPVLNTVIKQLAAPARTPMTGALADLATTIDNMSTLTYGLSSNWPLVHNLVDSINASFPNAVVPTITNLSSLIQVLPDIVVVLSKLTGSYGHFLDPVLDIGIPVTRLLGAGMRNFGDLLRIIPPLIRAFEINFDQDTGGLKIRYTPPRTRIPAKDPYLTCRNINQWIPNQCHVTDPNGMEVDALRLVLLATGAAR